MGLNGYVGYNVVWNVEDNREIYTKGDNHTVTNNVAWDDNDQSDCTVCVPTENSGNPMNVNTIVVNNGAQKMQSTMNLSQHLFYALILSKNCLLNIFRWRRCD